MEGGKGWKQSGMGGEGKERRLTRNERYSWDFEPHRDILHTLIGIPNVRCHRRRRCVYYCREWYEGCVRRTDQMSCCCKHLRRRHQVRVDKSS